MGGAKCAPVWLPKFCTPPTEAPRRPPAPAPPRCELTDSAYRHRRRLARRGAPRRRWGRKGWKSSREDTHQPTGASRRINSGGYRAAMTPHVTQSACEWRDRACGPGGGRRTCAPVARDGSERMAQPAPRSGKRTCPAAPGRPKKGCEGRKRTDGGGAGRGAPLSAVPLQCRRTKSSSCARGESMRRPRACRDAQ